MKMQPPPARCAVVILAGLSAFSSPITQAATGGPWAKVPPLTTACYQYVGEEPEPFYARLEAAKAAIQAERGKQEAINAKIEQDYQNIDPMEKASRMQQWMMSNPDEAMKFMQGQQAMAQALPQDIAAMAEESKARDAEWGALVRNYDDALIAAYAPMNASLTKLGHAANRGRADLRHPFFAGDPSQSSAVWAEGAAINAAADRAYQALCPGWWGANGKFHAYLGKQKDWFVKRRIPELQRGDESRIQQFAIMNSPAASYRSTAELQGVAEYLDLVWKVFGQRDTGPR